MKNILMIITSMLFVSCATKSNLRDSESKMKAHIQNEFSVLRDGLKKDMKTLILADSRKELVQEMKQEVYMEVEKTLSKDRQDIQSIVDQISLRFEEHKKVIKEVVAQSLISLKESLGNEVEFALTNGNFIQMLEKRIVDKLSGVSLKHLKDHKDQFIKECVSQTREQIVVEKIGVKASELQEVDSSN